MREMGKNHSSIVVFWILPKFCWMLPMGVRDNHTKYEPNGLRQAASGSPKRWVPKWVNEVRQVEKKSSFFKNDPGPHGMPKQVFLGRCRLVVAPFWLS